MRILGIESSCDETAAAVVENGRKVLSSVIASQVEEHKLPTSYWYMLEHAYGASGNFKNRERLKTRSGKVVKKWSDERFKYLTLEFDE